MVRRRVLCLALVRDISPVTILVGGVSYHLNLECRTLGLFLRVVVALYGHENVKYTEVSTTSPI